MPGSCCKNNSSKRIDASTFAAYVRQSMLCGIEGSAKFLISLSSYLQTAVYLRVCKKNILPLERSWEVAKNKAAVDAMWKGALPAFEAFVLMPTVFGLLHRYAGLDVVYCLAGCWAVMFLVCLTARLTRFLKGCPELAEQMYSSGRPFPAMKDTRVFLGDCSPTSSESSVGEMPLTFLKAFALSFLFIPLRAVTLFSTLVLFAAKLLSLPYAILSDIWATGKSVICRDSNYGGRVVYDNSFGCCRSVSYLVCAMLMDMLWICSLGISGTWSLKAAAEGRNTANAGETEGKTTAFKLSECPNSSVSAIRCLKESAPQHEMPGVVAS
ncbi:MAG: hypothetical protein AB8U44_02225 [Aaplasma endosymbiont of Hyalomma asiaticum]